MELAPYAGPYEKLVFPQIEEEYNKQVQGDARDEPRRVHLHMITFASTLGVVAIKKWLMNNGFDGRYTSLPPGFDHKRYLIKSKVNDCVFQFTTQFEEGILLHWRAVPCV